MVDGADVAPEEPTEEESEDVQLWKSLHHRLGHGARTQDQALPKPRTGRRKEPMRRQQRIYGRILRVTSYTWILLLTISSF